MSTLTETESRGIFERLRASPFLSELFRSRIAVAGLVIIAIMVLVAVYSRVQLFFLAAPEVGLTSIEAVTEAIAAGPSPVTGSRLGQGIADRAPPGWIGPAPIDQQLFGTDQQARDIYQRTLYGAWLALKWGTITVGLSTEIGRASCRERV